VFEYSGLNKLAQKTYDHTAAKFEYTGFIVTYENKMQSLYGRKKWDTIKEYTSLFDKEVYFERLEKGYLTNKEKNFIKETFEINVDKKTMIPRKGKSGEIAREHQKLMKKYVDTLIGEDGALRQVLNPAEFERYMKDKPIKFIKNNIYVHRRLTKEAKLALNPSGAQYKKLIIKQQEAVAEKLAKRYFDEDVKRNYTKEQFDKKKAKFIDDGTALSLAKAELAELHGGFNPSKFTPNFYKDRHTKLPEKMKVDGKWIETYEKSYSATTRDYAIGQAQFLANIEYFPEFVRMKKFKVPGAKDLIGELKAADKRFGTYVEKAVKDHLAIDKPLSKYPGGMRFLRETTSLAAKLQLSAPTSGLKNFLVGSTQSLFAFKLKDFMLSFADAIHKDNRAYVKATGATEIGLRSFEMKGVSGKLDKVASQFFRFGGMKFTENINRYISVLAGKRDQLGLASILQTAKEGTRVYKNAVNKLKSFYKLSDADIALLKEFGMEGVRGLDAKTAALNKRKLNKLYQKMNTFAHINTQGAAMNLFMPDWSSGEVAQASLLYKRMAYAATANTMRNMKIAYQNKSLFQPITFLLGSYFSGEALIAFYDKFYGQAMPKENSSEAKQLTTILYKGEFLGILSEFLSPFDNRFPGESLYPSLLSTGTTMWNSLMSTLTGDKFVSQGAKDFFKPVVGLYNGIDKVYKQGLKAKDSYASQSKRYRALYRDYVEEINDRPEVIGLNKTEMTFEMNRYMRKFREMFDSGYEKDGNGNSLGKWYMMCLFARANEYYYTKFTEDGIPVNTPKEALKEAVKQMDITLKDLNPNKVAVTAKNKKDRQKQIIKGKNFIDWLDEKEKLSPGLKKLNNQYAYRYNLTKKSAAEYIKSGNLEKDLKYYDISIRDILK